jgi:hypothetical protein
VWTGDFCEIPGTVGPTHIYLDLPAIWAIKKIIIIQVDSPVMLDEPVF